MKAIHSFFALCVLAIATSQAAAQLPAQPFIIPAVGDYGAFSVQDQAIGAADPDIAKAYDNFSLTTSYTIDGICFTGIYAEALPIALSDTDFVIEIWSENGSTGLADTAAGAVATFYLEGGPVAGTGGPDMTVTQLGHTSPSTATVFGGGEAFNYDATLTATTLAAGDYWISIIADQRFGNGGSIIDPEWMWHLGSGPGDGFAAFDGVLDPLGTPVAGIMQAGKDLAFELKGSIVPEPSTLSMTLLGLAALGLIRRKQK